MEIKEIIGIDVSKLTLDCCHHSSGCYKEFDNNIDGIASMVSWSLQVSEASKKKLLFIFEHTGLYSDQLIQLLGSGDYLFNVVPGLEIKRSLGIARGKDDRADAKRIALYGHRVKDEVKPFQIPSKTLDTLKRLMSMRKKLVTQRAGYIALQKEQKRVLSKQHNKVLFRVHQKMIITLDKQITIVEQEMDHLIEEDSELQNLYRLITSVKGIGGVTARFLIVYTTGFKSFETWRKFASYCGIAPFPYRSGTSIRGRTKVSHLANKEGKSLLSMCAVSAIQSNPEMKAYYNRRIDQGKNKMSTINIIRNKLLARAFAAVQRGTPYVDTMKFAC
jgi:transposase